MTYFTKIPEPKEGESMLFAFEDENIPKIENVKVATHTNTVTINDVFSYIDSLQDKAITPETIKEIRTKLESIEDISQEKKNAIINQLSSRINKQTTPQPQTNPVNTVPSSNIPPQMNMNIPMNPQTGMPQIPGLINPLPGMNPIGLNSLNQPRPQVPFGFFPGGLGPMPMRPPFPMMDQPRLFMEPSSRMNLSKYKTKPCRNYHSSMGCTRGDGCHFIHDPAFAGVEIPNFNPNNYEKIPFPGLSVPNAFPPNPMNAMPNLNNPNMMSNIHHPGEQNQQPPKEGDENAEGSGQNNPNNPNIINRNMMMRSPMMLQQNMMVGRPPMMMYMGNMGNNFRPPMVNMMPMGQNLMPMPNNGMNQKPSPVNNSMNPLNESNNEN